MNQHAAFGLTLALLASQPAVVPGDELGGPIPTRPAAEQSQSSDEVEEPRTSELEPSDSGDISDPSLDPGDDSTQEPTSGPSEEPTEDPSPQPSPEPTEDPSAEPTGEPTEEPTEEPSEAPTEPVPPPAPSVPVPEEPDDPPVPPVDTVPVVPNRPPQISPLAPLTARTRDEISMDDLLADVVVLDDHDRGLTANITGWDGWFSPVECPGGYPCTYTIVYSVTDSMGAWDDAVRRVTITGPGNPLDELSDRVRKLVDRTVPPALTKEPERELPETGISAGRLSGVAAGLFAMGVLLSGYARRRRP